MNHEERRLLEEELNMQEEINMLEEEEIQNEQAEISEEEGDGKKEEEEEKQQEEEQKEDKHAQENKEEEASCAKEDITEKKCEKKCALSCKKKWCLIGGAILVGIIVLALAVSAAVYSKDFRSDFVRAVSERLPYPAMIIGSEWVPIAQVLEEYDTMSAYIATLEGYPGLPDEEGIITTSIETVRRKVVVAQLAAQYGVELDETKVDEAYLAMSGGSANEEAFLTEMQEIFGMNKQELIAQVVTPLVLSQQLGEAVLKNEDAQAKRKEDAQGVYARLVAGEEFAVVAAEVNGKFNSLADGDLGTVKVSEIPQEWLAIIEAVEPGQFTEVYTDQNVSAHYLFLPGERSGFGEEEEIELSLIMVPFMQLQEAVTEYAEENVKWEFIDEDAIHELVHGEDHDHDAHAQEDDNYAEDEDMQEDAQEGEQEETVAEAQGGLTDVPSEE